uniref:Uncharacterized protein n=1 Tax=Aegilops tauschii subsp. strangulata TaxID=200361 RepID=A0A453L4U0_AEGTS
WISSATQATKSKEGIHCRQEGSRDLVRCVVVGLELGSSSSSASWSSSLAWKSDADSGHRGCLRKKATTDPCPASWSSRKRKSSSVRRHGRRSSRPASLGAGPSCWWGRTWPVAKMQRRVAGRFGEREGRAAMA